MNSLPEGPDVPLGLGLTLAQNAQALSRFAALSADQKQQMIDHTHQIDSKKEMQAYVEQFVRGELSGL